MVAARSVFWMLAVVLASALPRDAAAASLNAAGAGGAVGDDAHLIRDAGRAVRESDLVVEAVAARVLPPSPDIEIAVSAVLKGRTGEERVSVRLEKSSMGRWPKEGEARIFCLSARPEGGYELATHYASILPASEEARRAVRRLVGARAREKSREMSDEKPAPPPDRRRKTPNPYLRTAAASDAILVGTLAGVESEAGSSTDVVGSFSVEGALFGYGDFRAPVPVRFPARGVEAPPPPPGRYLLFLAGSRSGDGFVVVKAVRLSGAALEGEAKRLALEAIGPRTARLTTIQATLAEWQDAWNAQDVARCILCYGRESRLRRRYASGGIARRELEREIRASPGTVAVSIEKICVVLAPTSEGARETAEVEVTVELTPLPGAAARLSAAAQAGKPATMQFIRENGEWLILREGF